MLVKPWTGRVGAVVMGSRSSRSFAAAVALLVGSGAWPGLSCLALSPPAAAGEPGGKIDPATVDFFETKVRPVLANHCWQCHGPDRQKASLRLDSREALLKGGETGPAIVTGKPEEGLLLEAVRYDGSVQMPPKGKLGKAEIEAL